MSKETSVEVNATSIAPESGSSFPADLTAEQAANASTLMDWLGSFWSEVYEDPEFIEYLEGARALKIAQLYLDLLENLKLKDRSDAPVFHRERWHPIVLRKSMAGTGSKNLFKVGRSHLDIGEQKGGVYYPDGTVVTLGGKNVDIEGMVVYRLDGESDSLKSVLTCICNNIADASVVLSKGSDFAILDGAIAISRNRDPFVGDDADMFPKFEVLAENPEDNDVETVLWACDTMFDRDFLYRNLGYAISLPTGSSEVFKRVVNSAWNIIASGCTPLLLTSLIATICGIPTVKERGEVVESIIRENGRIKVVTDKNVYDLSDRTELRKDVVQGAVLDRFDTLDTAVRIYPCVTDVDRLPTYSKFVSDLDEFKDDVPAVDLPPAYFRSSLDNGFSVDWEEVPVVCHGFDKNGNPKLSFELEGSDMDNDEFWNDVWESYEETGNSMASLFDVTEELREGAVVGMISPIRFFLQNLIGANTILITVRTDSLEDSAPLYDPKFFEVVRSSIPAYLRLYMVEHGMVDDSSADDSGSTADDSAELELYDDVDDDVEYGVRGRGSKMHDRVDSRWVAACKDEYDD